MAMSGVVIPEMAAVSGLLPNTVERIIRDLRASGMAPMGQHGRGQTHGQFDQFHLANLLLAFAALQPSGSADAVRALNQLQHEWGGGGELARVLASEIERRALLIIDGSEQCLSLLSEGFELTLCLDPVEAWTGFVVEDRTEGRQRWVPQTTPPWLPEFAPAPAPRRGLCRLTIITVDVLNVAGRLRADTIRRKQNLPIPTAPGAETENATPARVAPIQDRNSTIPTSSKRELRRERENAQALSSRGPGFRHHTPRSPPRVEESPPLQPLA